jgi:CelD/BcsL family acetyltransferase involved in cellulose biosynthesis
VRLVHLADITRSEIGAWAELVRGAVEPNPTFEPGFLSAAALAFSAADPCLLVLEEGGYWLGALPVVRARLGGVFEALVSWDHPYAFLGTPLVAGGHLGAFAAAAAGSVAGRGHGFLWLKTCSDGAVLAAIREAVEAEPRATTVYETRSERAMLERRPEDDYLSGMKTKRRRELNRQRRRLGEELGGEGPAETVDRSEDPGAIADFLRLEAGGWKGREGTAMAAQERDAALMREICDRFREQGRLQVLALESGGRAAAMKVNVSAGDTLFCFKIAYDEELAHFSPGILLEVDNVHAFHARRDEPLMDSCAQPDNEMINRLWPERRPMSRVMFGPNGPSSRLLRLAHGGARRLKRSDRD